MNPEYFPKTDIEYEYYFDIETLRKVKTRNEERQTLLKKCGNDAFLSEIAGTLDRIEQLNDILAIMIAKDGIEDYATYYSYHNTALLINRKIEHEFALDNFKKKFTALISPTSKKEGFVELFCVGNILFPRGRIIHSLMSHGVALISLLYIGAAIIICIRGALGDISFFEALPQVITCCIVSGISVAISHKIIFAIQKNRMSKLKNQYTYWHKPINSDFFTNFVDKAVQNKVDKF